MSLKPSEKNYPAHKLDFLALKWSITEKFHDYLYGAKTEMSIEDDISEQVFVSTSLTSRDWHKAHAADRDIRAISEALEKGQNTSSLNAERNGVDTAFLPE